jgi:aerobic-type carbon monoxide dehydrogenase small subunit (CoxS/CutS family)
MAQPTRSPADQGAATGEIVVNGVRRSIAVDPRKPLLGVLREDLGLIGAKIGCGEGECGACTVLVDDRPVRSCVTPFGDALGKRVLTIEGLEALGALHPLQQAFLERQAFQCGYCTPGMIMAALALLLDKPDPTDEQIARSMQGNICRCGTYARVVQAIREAGAVLREQAAAEDAR